MLSVLSVHVPMSGGTDSEGPTWKEERDTSVY